jgi:hypothetical protein
MLKSPTTQYSTHTSFTNDTKSKIDKPLFHSSDLPHSNEHSSTKTLTLELKKALDLYFSHCYQNWIRLTF